MRIPSAFRLLCSLILAPTLFAQSPAKRLIAIDDMFRVREVGNPNAKSPKGATGPMQVTPKATGELNRQGFDAGNMTPEQKGTTSSISCWPIAAT
jgi:hypothetical protein